MTPGLLVLESCTVDLRSRRVARDGVELSLTTREAELLAYVVARPDTDVSHDELHAAFGYRASANTRAALHVVARLRRKIERDPAQPRHLLSVHGVGYRWTLGGAAAPPNALVGREALVVEVLDRLAAHPLVTLKGFGGVGKSRVASEVATRWIGGATWVDAADAETPERLFQAIARALGVTLDGTRLDRPDRPDGLDLLGQAVARTGLAVLDDAWLGARAVAALAALRQRAPGVRWLVTARSALQLAEERVIEVPPLARDDAVRLLAERCAAGGWSLEDEAGAAVLVDRLDRLPLGILLAAPRLAVLGPAELAARLAEDHDLLDARAVDGRPEHASLRLVFEQSWRVLEPVVQAALSELVVFDEPFDLAAAEAVVSGPGVADRLERLLAVSLLGRRSGGRLPGSVRFALPAVVRDFAKERLQPDAELGAIRRHAVWFSALPIAAGAQVSRATACRYAIRLGDPALAVAACGRLGQVAARAGFPGAAVELADAVASLALTPDERARVALTRAMSLAVGGRLLEAEADLERVLREPLTDPVASEVWIQLGYHRGEHGDFAGARIAADRAAASDPSNPHVTLMRAGIAMRTSEAGGFSLASEAVDRFRARGDTRSMSLALQVRGATSIPAGRLADARADLELARDLFEAEGDHLSVLVATGNLARVSLGEGALDDAIALYDEAAAEAERLGLVRREAHLRQNLGCALLLHRELERSEVELRRAVRLGRDSADLLSEGLALAYLGQLAVLREQWDEARTVLAGADARLANRGSHRVIALIPLAEVACADGDPERARAQLDRADQILAGTGWGDGSRLGGEVARTRERLGLG